MNRLSLLAAAGVLFAAPAGAQTTTDGDTMLSPADTSMVAEADTSMASDSTMTLRVVDTDAARALNAEGVELATAGSFEDALAKYDQALVADPNFAPAFYGRAQALGQLGRLDESRAAYEQTIAASQGDDLEYVRTPAQRDLREVERAIVTRDSVEAVNASIAAQNQSVEMQTEAIEAAAASLEEFPLSEANAQAGYEQLERARTAGYDANGLAFYYAKALNGLGRGAEALPYAEQALAESEEEDKSPYYIQIGIAQRFAANDPAAREAFEAAKAGSWASWADYYLAEMGAASN